MANPNDVEAFQSFCRKYVNKKIREYFSDVNSLADSVYNSSNARFTARNVCLHKDNDPISLTVGRLILYYSLINDPDEIDYEVEQFKLGKLRAGKPIITLFFIEPITDVEPGYSRVEGKIGFRLMNETNSTLTRNTLLQFARKIKTLFAGSTPYVWKKGKTMYSYTDWEKGYQLQLLCRNKSEAKKLITNVLDIQTHKPTWEYFQEIQNDSPTSAFPTIPETETILGTRVRQPRKRPIADVIFREASIKIPGLQNKIVLYNRLNTKRNAILVD